jgi:hypothetical protein
MSRIFSVLIFLCVTSFAGKGPVVYAPSGCDWYVVETSMGMVLLEWYGGNSPDVGDIIVGELSGYGMRDLYNISAGSETRAWQDDYMLSKESALEQLYEECE